MDSKSGESHRGEDRARSGSSESDPAHDTTTAGSQTPGAGTGPAGRGAETALAGRRTATAWFAIATGLVVLVVLLVFILQNLERVRVSFFTLHWRIPLAVDLLFATVLGGTIVFIAGSLHIYQLRRQVRRHQAHDHGRPR